MERHDGRFQTDRSGFLKIPTMPLRPVPHGRRQVLPRCPVDAPAGQSSSFRTGSRRLRGVVRRLSFVISLLVCAVPTSAGASDSEDIPFFESRVRPLLADHCYRCHSAKAEKVKAGLLVDSREGLLKGGESGPALVAGQPEQSRLIEAVRYSSPDLQMPPKGRLSDRAGGRPRAVGRDRSPMAGQRRAGGRLGGSIRHRTAARHALGLAAREGLGAAGCRGWAVDADSRRPVHSRPPGSRPPATGAARGPSVVAPADPLRARRAPTHAGGGRDLSRRRGTRRRGAGGRPAAGVAAVRRAMGSPLDGPRPLQRHARQRSRHAHPQRLALPRLPRPRLQRRRALRSAHPRTPRRRPARRSSAPRRPGRQ